MHTYVTYVNLFYTAVVFNYLTYDSVISRAFSNSIDCSHTYEIGLLWLCPINSHAGLATWFCALARLCPRHVVTDDIVQHSWWALCFLTWLEIDFGQKWKCPESLIASEIGSCMHTLFWICCNTLMSKSHKYSATKINHVLRVMLVWSKSNGTLGIY